MIRTLAPIENPLFSRASMSAAACASRNPCRVNQPITRRRTRSESGSRSPWASGLAGRNAGGPSGPCGPGFGGSLVDLESARINVPPPVLRKEFVVDPYQVVEARAHGADAVLLIAECLDDCRLRSLYRAVLDLGMAPLMELHDAANLGRVLDLGAALVGVNSRDLRTMTTDLGHVLLLRDRVPDDVVLVAGSGIRTRADVERLAAAGIDALLVRESLLGQPGPGLAAAALLGR